MTPTDAQAVLPHYIAGAFQNETSGETFADVNPSDSRDVIARVPAGDPEDMARAVDAAATALTGWRRRTGSDRANILYSWAEAIDARAEEIAQAVCREVGKPIREARGEVGRCVVILRYYAGDAVRSKGEVVPAMKEGALQFTLRDPLGVVGLITPWNFPVAIPLWKAAPALAFGNTVVLKPAEQSSQVAILLAETAEKAGVPAGVFNVVLGSGSVVGEALVRAEPVRGVSFTGSVAVGSQVAAICAERNIRYQTEMGGKNVVIVRPDADLDLAADLTVAGAMGYAGQKCTATSRAIVDRRVEEDFLARVQKRVQGLALAPVTDAAVSVGPVISEASRERVRSALASPSGDRVVGGGDLEGEPFAHGFFIEPTVLRGVDPDSEVAQEELFGPVLSTFTADDLDEALSLANRTRYGLSASLFTRDVGEMLSYIDRIQVGLVRVNGDTTGVDPHAPFGGFKSSSSGSREQGSAAREFYTEVKTVQVNP